MTEAMPYLNIYATEEIPADMQDEVDAQKAAEEESGSTEEGTEEETAEEELPEGTLIDPNTVRRLPCLQKKSWRVKMPEI